MHASGDDADDAFASFASALRLPRTNYTMSHGDDFFVFVVFSFWSNFLKMLHRQMTKRKRKSKCAFDAFYDAFCGDVCERTILFDAARDFLRNWKHFPFPPGQNLAVMLVENQRPKIFPSKHLGTPTTP